MNYELIEKGIGIVVLGQFNPQLYSLDNLCGLSIIKREEMEYTKQDEVNANYAVLNVGNIRIMCDRLRFQILTTDIVLVRRMLAFCQDMLNAIEINNLRGVGLNTHFKITINNEDDNQVFRERLMPPMTSWNNLCGGGNIENVAIKHDNRLICLSSDGLLDGNHGYSFDVNKHHKTDRLIDIISVLDGANEYFSTEMTSLEAFIREL